MKKILTLGGDGGVIEPIGLATGEENERSFCKEWAILGNGGVDAGAECLSRLRNLPKRVPAFVPRLSQHRKELVK